MLHVFHEHLADEISMNIVCDAACLQVGTVIQAKAAALDSDAVVNSELVGELRSVQMLCQARSSACILKV